MKQFLLLVLAITCVSRLYPQVILPSMGATQTIDFSGFGGTGFSAGPSDGQLSSNDWAVTGFSDGDIPFGGEGTTGDFARGTTTGGVVTTGGIYAYDVAGNQMLWVQPTAIDFTPGSFTLKLQNNTGLTIGQLTLSYTVFAFNDEDRANSFNCSWSTDDVLYADIPECDYTSPEAMSATIDEHDMSATISGLSVADGDYIYLKWTGDDVSGSGSRDEFGIDDIAITPFESVASPMYSFGSPSLAVDESVGVTTMDISLSESADCTFHINFDASSTATISLDYGFDSFDVTFTAGGPTTQTINIGIVDDIAVEGTEDAYLYLTTTSGTCVAGPIPNMDLSILDDDSPGTAGASFAASGTTTDEAVGIVTVGVQLTEAADCDLQVSLDGASTMTEGTDYSLTLPMTVSFTADGPTTETFDVIIVDDLVSEPDETLTMNLSVLSGTCVTLSPAGYDLLLHDDDEPDYTPSAIADVHGEDADGVCNSIGELVSLTGTVYGINIWDGGLQFTLIDATGGISVFSFADAFGYTVTEGDNITVNGTIDQFNGLTEIIPDTILFNSSGNPLKIPTDFTVLDESTESDLVRTLNYVYLTNEAQWLGDGTSFNVDITDGGSTYTMRIDNNTEMSSMPVSSVPGLFYVTGLGTQFDTNAPYTEGYQIMPRYMGDIEAAHGIQQLSLAQMNIYPNPADDIAIIHSAKNIQSVEIINQLGETVKIISVNNTEAQMDLSKLPAGFYSLKLRTDDGLYSAKLMVE